MARLQLLIVLVALGCTQALRIEKKQTPMMTATQPYVNPREGGGLCAGGTVVPQLYFLGAQKAATTTISESFQSAGGSLARNPQCMRCVGLEGFSPNEGMSMKQIGTACKQSGGLWHPYTEAENRSACEEASFFWQEDHFKKERRIFNSDRDEDIFEKPYFLSELSRGYPECPDTGAPPVLAADFSTYLACPIATRRIKVAYGAAAPSLTFALSLREPLGRLESAWSHLKAEPWADGWTKPVFYANHVWDSFDSFARNVMHAYNRTRECLEGHIGDGCDEAESLKPGFTYEEGEHDMDIRLWNLLRGSLYGARLQALLQDFDASQVIIAPMMDIVSGGEKAVMLMQKIQNKTGTNVEELQAMPGVFAAAFTHQRVSNSHSNNETSNATSEDDEKVATSLAVQQLQDILHRDAELLVNLLASHTEISLPTFDGPERRPYAIWTWLSSSW